MTIGRSYLLASLWLAASLSVITGDAIFLLHRSAAMQVTGGSAASAITSIKSEVAPLGNEFARDAWVQCIDENDAELVMVTTIDIPGIVSGMKYEVPIKRCRCKDEAGNFLLPGAVCSMLNCDGATGCLGISINVKPEFHDGADAGLPLNVYIYWIQHGRQEGVIDQKVVLPVGPSARVDLAASSMLAVEFRRPRPMPRPAEP